MQMQMCFVRRCVIYGLAGFRFSVGYRLDGVAALQLIPRRLFLRFVPIAQTVARSAAGTQYDFIFLSLLQLCVAVPHVEVLIISVFQTWLPCKIGPGRRNVLQGVSTGERV